MASVGSGVLASQGKLSLMQSALAASRDYSTLDDYKSLVCIFMFGGNDAFNMFMPYAQSDYDQYASIRGSLAIPRQFVLPVTGDQYGFHPSMTNIRNLYNAGQLSVLANTGTLLEPTTREDYQNQNVAVPPDLFSHSHQMEMWQTDKPPVAGITQDGWGGKMADLLRDANSNPQIPPTLTLFGNNNWQAGRLTQQLALNPSTGAQQFLFLADESWPPWEASRTQAWANIVNRSGSHPLVNEAGSSFGRAREQIELLLDALDQVPTTATQYDPNNYVATQLQMVAKMISVREYLGMKRQLFFVGIGNWDSHGTQLTDHATNLSLLDNAVASFNSNIQELNADDSVLTFTMSEFGRTLTVNGDGTDHGWGTHCLLMGGPVAGGAIHGQMPTLEIGGPDDTDFAGRIIPTSSLDQYAATLGTWLGITSSDLNEIFPNLGNFATSDLGFLS